MNREEADRLIAQLDNLEARSRDVEMGMRRIRRELQVLTRITALVSRNDEHMREEGRREVLWLAERDLKLGDTPTTEPQFWLMKALKRAERYADGRPFVHVVTDPESASIGIVIAHADMKGLQLIREHVAKLEAEILPAGDPTR